MKITSRFLLFTFLLATVLLGEHSAHAEESAEESMEEFLDRRMSQMENIIKGTKQRLDMHMSGEKILKDDQVKKLEKKKQAVADKLGSMVNWSEEEKQKFFQRRQAAANKKGGMPHERLLNKKKKKKRKKKKKKKKLPFE